MTEQFQCLPPCKSFFLITIHGQEQQYRNLLSSRGRFPRAPAAKPFSPSRESIKIHQNKITLSTNYSPTSSNLTISISFLHILIYFILPPVLLSPPTQPTTREPLIITWIRSVTTTPSAVWSLVSDSLGNN